MINDVNCLALIEAISEVIKVTDCALLRQFLLGVVLLMRAKSSLLDLTCSRGHSGNDLNI